MPTPPAELDATTLIGAWTLLEFRVEFDDGAPPLHPLGVDARGRLAYTPDGRVSAVLSRADRAPLGVGGLESAHRAEDAAKARAFDSYMSYAGRFRLDGDEVVHTLELALLPDAVGSEQRRRVSWDGETLTLGYEQQRRSGGTRRYRLRWRRVEAG